MNTLAPTEAERKPSEDAEPLEQSGYFCVVRSSFNAYYFNCVTSYNERVAQVAVFLPSQWDRGRSALSRLSVSSSSDIDKPEAARAIAETITLASNFLEALNADMLEQARIWEEQEAERRARREQERQEYFAQREVEREQRARATAARQEELQYLVGEKFRLKRRGYKAVVFGTIKDFRNGRMYTVSEKAKYMNIKIMDIYWLQVKWAGSNEYETIIDEPEHPEREN